MKKTAFVFVAVVMLIGLTANYFYNAGKGGGSSRKDGIRKISPEDAMKELEGMVGDIDWKDRPVQRRAQVALGTGKDLTRALPNISQFKLVVDPPAGPGDLVVEIFASTEKSGTGSDGVMVEMAKAFNAANRTTSTGKTARVRIRKIASGTGYEFIASNKYRPDAFSPSNHLWIQMAAAHGVPVSPVREKMVGNIAGVVMKSAVADRLRQAYGDLNVKNIIAAVIQGKMIMGYTNPFASSTGLNFLVTVLSSFADGDPDKMLSPEVVSSFESFQRGVPFVALTTLQMRDSVQNDGSLEAFVMEYQTFRNTAVLASGYEFIPFGVRHDNPLYTVGDIGEERKEALELFAAFSEKASFQEKAKEYGFNPSIAYDNPMEVPPGAVLVAAQKLWKEKKDAGRPIAAVFLCDVSGSMQGGRLNRLKQALIGGSEFIGAANSIGLTLFNNEVIRTLPIRPFDLAQKSMFHAAVEDMDANGNTAMYDGVAVALSFLTEEKRKHPDSKPMLFVLTDGETNKGLSFDEIAPVIAGIGIPVYTIGYEANINELGRLSSLVEAASLNAGEEEIEYKIGALLNAQM